MLIHNISDRPNTQSIPHAVMVSNVEIRPGKAASVNEDHIGKKCERLHGRVLWFGELPAKYRATSKAALRALDSEAGLQDAMTAPEVRNYLSDLEYDELESLCSSMSPPLEFAKRPSARMLIVKLASALFSGSRTLDPENFFWLRRWTRNGDTYLER